jgi:hypothetical protein
LAAPFRAAFAQQQRKTRRHRHYQRRHVVREMEPRGAEHFTIPPVISEQQTHGGIEMKTNLLTAAIAATAIVGLSSAALAQGTTGPAAQDNNTKMDKDMSKDGMKGSNSNMAPTTGANTSPSQKPMTTPAEPKGKESNSETPKR